MPEPHDDLFEPGELIPDEDEEIAELVRMIQEAEESDARDMADFWTRFEAEQLEIADLLREDPYKELADALRATGADEHAIYEALLKLSEERQEDPGTVFGILYGDGSMKPPSEGVMDDS